MKHCYETALYTTEAQALSVTHACIVYRTREIRSVVYGRNAEYLPVSRIKNGRLLCARKYGNAVAIFETKSLYEKHQINSGASTILSP